jgi:hypothetical protein
MPKVKVPPVKKKKKYNTKPTLKHKKVIKILAENGRKAGSKKKKTIGNVLKEAGYSKSVQESPTKVTESKGFKELLKEMLPDNEVVKLQKDLMYAARLDSRDVDDELTNKQITILVESVAGCTVKKILRSKNNIIKPTCKACKFANEGYE